MSDHAIRPAIRGVAPGEPGRLDVPKLHCRGCGEPVPKGRRNWCGQECIDRHLLRNNGATARAKTFERDHGVCAECARDTEALKAKLERWFRAVHERDSMAQYRRRMDDPHRLRWHLRLKWRQTHLWEMDHILPVVEGGGGCGLDNLRTLCRPCHRRATKALARRRAIERARGGK